MFCKIGPRAQCCKTFYSRNLRIFVISYSVCPQQAFPVKSNKHSSLMRKSVKHGPKMFCKIGPRAQCHKTFYGHYLLVFVIRQSVYSWEAYLAQSNGLGKAGGYPTAKHVSRVGSWTNASLLRTFVNNGHQSCYNIGP